MEDRSQKAESRSKFVFALGVKQLVGAIVIPFGNEHFRGTIQITVVRLSGVDKFLRGFDAVFFQHHHKHLGVDHRAGVEQFHSRNYPRWTARKQAKVKKETR